MGLDYAQNRYYSSVLGRFITPDPYVGNAGLGDPGSWNKYAYVENDPVNFTDSQGLFLSASFHSDIFVMAEPSRAVVRQDPA